MLSAYPAITKTDFYEAGAALQRAHDAFGEETDWVEFKCTSKDIFIRQKRNTLQNGFRSEPLVVSDERCEEVEELERKDKELLHRNSPCSLQHIFIDFSIVLSPTYQVPVLWFTSPSVPITRSDALDQIYNDIVSPASRTGLRQVGVLGGISMAEHPNSGLPAFFIHPCRTQEALEVVRPDRDILPIEYLMLWFGIIGAPIGLSVPSMLARLISTPEDEDSHAIAQLKNGDESNGAD